MCLMMYIPHYHSCCGKETEKAARQKYDPFSEYSSWFTINASCVAKILYEKQSKSLSISKISSLTCLTADLLISSCFGRGSPDPSRSSIS